MAEVKEIDKSFPLFGKIVIGFIGVIVFMLCCLAMFSLIFTYQSLQAFDRFMEEQLVAETYPTPGQFNTNFSFLTVSPKHTVSQIPNNYTITYANGIVEQQKLVKLTMEVYNSSDINQFLPTVRLADIATGTEYEVWLEPTSANAFTSIPPLESTTIDNYFLIPESVIEAELILPTSAQLHAEFSSTLDLNYSSIEKIYSTDEEIIFEKYSFEINGLSETGNRLESFPVGQNVINSSGEFWMLEYELTNLTEDYIWTPTHPVLQANQRNLQLVPDSHSYDPQLRMNLECNQLLRPGEVITCIAIFDVPASMLQERQDWVGVFSDADEIEYYSAVTADYKFVSLAPRG